MTQYLSPLTLAALNTDWMLEHIAQLIAGVIVALAIFFGLRDFSQFSIKRIWAISSVCFSESIRRRVLWITPLAIVGVMIVTQLQRPLDEQDAIRQTTKFCLFTTGLVVMIVTILLACTSLPKEIENRVIFTIVTKPTTRLEIVLGKTLGFARVSAAILLIMGLFTVVYLKVRAWNLERDIAMRLETGAFDQISRPALEHYKAAGLLNAKTFAFATDLQFYSALPEIGADRRFAGAGGDGQILIPFDLDPQMFKDLGNPNVQYHIAIAARIGCEPIPGSKASTKPATQPSPTGLYGPSPLLSSTQPTRQDDAGIPAVAFGILDADEVVITNDLELSETRSFPIKSGEITTVGTEFKPEVITKLANVAKSPGSRRIYLSIAGSDPNFTYSVDSDPVKIAIITETAEGTKPLILSRPADPFNKDAPAAPIFRGGYSRYGQVLNGTAAFGPVAVYRFRQAIPTDGLDHVNFEIRLGIERSGTDNADLKDTITNLSMQIRNITTGKMSDPVTYQPESNRTGFFKFPASAIDGGEFELVLRCTSPQHQIGIRQGGLAMAVTQGNFYFNLFKSLAIFWMLSVLVVSSAIFCSTFLSWPIAVVLCVVVLLGHWGVEQLGDSTKPGLGAAVATDFGFRDPRKARVISGTVETLSKFLNTLALVLPDISQFPATEDIERGISIPHDKLWNATREALSYGLPMLLLGYVVFKNKEVAP